MNDEVSVSEQVEKTASASITAEAVANTVESIVPAGAQLAALREARGWTTAEIASQLNLANRQIQALEADNYAALPGMVIVRGFVRAYAKVLQTDPAPILAAIVDANAEPVAQLAERNTLSASFSETKLSPSGPRGFSFKVIVGAVLIAVLGVAVFAGQHFGWIPSSMTSQTSKVEEKLAPIETGEIVEAPPSQAEVIETTVAPSTNESKPANMTSTISTPVPAASAPAAPESKAAVVDAKPAAAPVVPAPAAVSKPVAAADANKIPVAPPLAVAVPVNSKDALAIKVREDSWVEIKRADNSVLVSRLLKAGTSEVVAVTEPVSMVIGNAAGVDVSLRGKLIDVVTGNSSNVARLNLK
ncbi:helix-turn-helix domain-containing protein [Herminiimonas aquatilis]|uniref:Helix-turn-helix domain-containing protein n=1 Tax=Herminiimonas aquatilis TaxID=345342 RepID=A0ABW2J774_9BURK